MSDGVERGAFSLIALDPLSAAPRLTIGMEEFTVYDYHPLRWIAPLISVLREPVRNNVDDYEVDTTMERLQPPFLPRSLLRDELPDLDVRRACSAAAKVKGRAVPETRIASTRGVPVTVGDPWRAFSPSLWGGGRIRPSTDKLYRSNLTRARIREIPGRMFTR